MCHVDFKTNKRTLLNKKHFWMITIYAYVFAYKHPKKKTQMMKKK